MKIRLESFASHPLTVLLGRVGLGAVFLFAAAPKIADPEAFIRGIHHYKMLPHPAVALLGWWLPWLEMLCGVLLVLGVWTRAAAAVVGCLLAVFLVAVGLAVARGLNIDCGCFGTEGGRTVGILTLLQDLGFMVLALQAFFWGEKMIENPPAGELNAMGAPR